MAGYPDIYDDIYEPDTGLAQSIEGVLFQSVPSFFVGTVTGGSLTLSGVLFESAPTFFVGSLAYGQTLGGVLFQSAPFFPTGQISNPLGTSRPFRVVLTDQSYRLILKGYNQNMTVGETYVPEGAFLDADNVPYEPDLVTVRIIDPSQIETLPPVLHVGTGVYQAPFIGTERGVWRGWMRGEGPGANMVIEPFSVCFVEDE